MNPGDVQVKLLAIGGLDVRFCVSELNVYENLTKPYTAVQATFVDSSNMLNNLFTSPGLTLQLSFGQRGQRLHSGTYAVTSVERGKSLENLRTATYTVTGYSRHMTRMPRVEKSYREVTATDIASDVVSSFLSPDKGLVVRDPAKGVQGNQHMPYLINGVQVHKAIRSVLERGVGAIGTAYTFFENRDNMVIDTLESALDRAFSSQGYTYTQRPLGHNFLLDQVNQNFTILALSDESRQDSTDLTQTISQASNPLDLFSQTGQRTNVGKGPVSTIMNIVYDSMRPPTHLAQALPQRKTIASQFDSQTLAMSVPLNVELTVGDGVGLDIVSPRGDTSFNEKDNLSGPMLMTEIRHSVKFGRQRVAGVTSVRGTRGGR